MWIRDYSKVYQDVNQSDIWRIWQDVCNWPSWHDDLEYCKMNGTFTVGNYFTLKPKRAPAVKVHIIEVVAENKFTDCTEFFGAKMLNTHTIEETKVGLKLSNKMVVTGPLKWLWIFLVARNVAKTIPNEIDALVTLSRKQ